MSQIRDQRGAQVVAVSATDERALEARARRAARRVGLVARKSRQRSNVPNLDNFGEFMLVDGYENFVVAGERFDLSAGDVLDWVRQLQTTTPSPLGDARGRRS